MWHLKKIPKIAHFYWGGKKLSYLQFMTVYTFWQLNPDWEIRLHIPMVPGKAISWNTKEQEYETNYDDFKIRLAEIPMKITSHNFESYGLSNNMTEVHKSDILRLKLLNQFGGLYSDMDIVFIKPMSELACNSPLNANKDTFVCVCHYGHSIGFLMSSVHNHYYNTLYEQARNILSSQELGTMNYQQIGALMINKQFKDVTRIPGDVYNLSMDAVYPYDAQHISALFTQSTSRLTANTIGVHWFAGHRLAGEFLNNTNGGFKQVPGNMISWLLKKCYLNSDYPIPLPFKDYGKIFLFGVSGTGKSTLCKNYVNRYNICDYYDFDLNFGIINNGWSSDSVNAAKNFLNNAPERFITEFIPIKAGETNLEIRYKDFLEYASEHKDVVIMIVRCSDYKELGLRLARKCLTIPSFEPDLTAIELFKSKNIPVYEYDTKGQV